MIPEGWTAQEAADRQRLLDAWIADNEQMEVPTALGPRHTPQAHFQRQQESAFAKGYNAGSRAAAEAIRQGNWTWEEYQEHLAARKL